MESNEQTSENILLSVNKKRDSNKNNNSEDNNNTNKNNNTTKNNLTENNENNKEEEEYIKEQKIELREKLEEKLEVECDNIIHNEILLEECENIKLIIKNEDDSESPSHSDKLLILYNLAYDKLLTKEIEVLVTIDYEPMINPMKNYKKNKDLKVLITEFENEISELKNPMILLQKIK